MGPGPVVLPTHGGAALGACWEIHHHNAVIRNGAHSLGYGEGVGTSCPVSRGAYTLSRSSVSRAPTFVRVNQAGTAFDIVPNLGAPDPNLWCGTRLDGS